MQIQVNTDNHVAGRDAFVQEIQTTVQHALGRFEQQLTRVEVHVGDENGHKGGDDDKRCAMEARPAGHQPVAVTHTAPSVELAVAGAAKKLKAALDHTFGKLHDHRGHTPAGGAPGA